MASESEPVSVECIDNFTSGNAAEAAPGDGHTLDGDGYSRFRGNNDLLRWFLWNGFLVFNQFLEHHLDDFLNVLEGFVSGFPPGCSRVFLQNRTIR